MQRVLGTARGDTYTDYTTTIPVEKPDLLYLGSFLGWGPSAAESVELFGFLG